jgi:hypothetical protein
VVPALIRNVLIEPNLPSGLLADVYESSMAVIAELVALA